jgi:hypothetical protein
MFLFGLSAAWQDNSAAIGGRQMAVNQLDGFKFL